MANNFLEKKPVKSDKTTKIKTPSRSSKKETRSSKKADDEQFEKKPVRSDKTTKTKTPSRSSKKETRSSKKADDEQYRIEINVKRIQKSHPRQSNAEKEKLLKKHFSEISFKEFLDSIINVVEGKDRLSISFAGSYLLAKLKECKMYLYDRNFNMESLAKKIKDVRRHYKQKSLAASIASIKNPNPHTAANSFKPMAPAITAELSKFWSQKKYQVNVGKEGVWINLDNDDTILDCYNELHVFTVDVDQATINAILTKAKEQWNSRIEISGDKAFKQKLYHAAIEQGIEVVGYNGGVGIVKEPKPINQDTSEIKSKNNEDVSASASMQTAQANHETTSNEKNTNTSLSSKFFQSISDNYPDDDDELLGFEDIGAI